MLKRSDDDDECRENMHLATLENQNLKENTEGAGGGGLGRGGAALRQDWE